MSDGVFSLVGVPNGVLGIVGDSDGIFSLVGVANGVFSFVSMLDDVLLGHIVVLGGVLGFVFLSLVGVFRGVQSSKALPDGLVFPVEKKRTCMLDCIILLLATA